MAKTGTSLVLTIPRGYEALSPERHRELFSCVREQYSPDGGLVAIVRPEEKKKIFFMDYCIVLFEKREDPIDRVDFISLKEFLREKLEDGGDEVLGLLPEKLCDMSGDRRAFSSEGTAGLLHEREGGISWLYSAPLFGPGQGDAQAYLSHAIRLHQAGLLHVIHIFIAPPYLDNKLLSLIKSDPLLFDLHLQEGEMSSGSGWTHVWMAGLGIFLLICAITCGHRLRKRIERSGK